MAGGSERVAAPPTPTLPRKAREGVIPISQRIPSPASGGGLGWGFFAASGSGTQSMTSPSAYFSATYAEARDKFREAARKAGARLTHYVNPTKGPHGETLTTDVARLGPAAAECLL